MGNPERCSVCGAEGYPGAGLTREPITFRGPQLYCSRCITKLYNRVFAVLAFGILLFGFFSIRKIFDPTLTLWEKRGVSLPFLVMVQWLLIFPHELGHALAARWCGCKCIQILVGAGRSFLRGEMWGFHWSLQWIPFGGLTVAQDNDKLTKKDLILFVVAGPAVNLIFAAIIYFMIGPTSMILDWTFWHVLFWANVLLLIENLWPYRIHVWNGVYSSDGLALLDLVLPHNDPRSGEIRKRSQRLLKIFIKLVATTFVGALTACMAAIGIFICYQEGRTDPYISLFVGSITFLLGSLLVYLCYKIIKS